MDPMLELMSYFLGFPDHAPHCCYSSGKAVSVFRYGRARRGIEEVVASRVETQTCQPYTRCVPEKATTLAAGVDIPLSGVE